MIPEKLTGRACARLIYPLSNFGITWIGITALFLGISISLLQTLNSTTRPPNSHASPNQNRFDFVGANPL
jgi:hypothetical protein